MKYSNIFKSKHTVHSYYTQSQKYFIQKDHVFPHFFYNYYYRIGTPPFILCIAVLYKSLSLFMFITKYNIIFNKDMHVVKVLYY